MDAPIKRRRSAARSVTLIGAEIECGSPHAGPSLGPRAVFDALRRARSGSKAAALRAALARERTVRLPPRDLPLDEKTDAIGAFCDALAEMTQSVVAEGGFPVVIGGDHAVAIGSWRGIAAALAARGEKLALLWLDAHLDAHTFETTETNAIHGMPAAALLGAGDARLRAKPPALSAERIAVAGVRSFESGERAFVEAAGIEVAYMDRIAKEGTLVVLRRLWQRLLATGARVGISLDLDGLDPEDAPGVSIPVPGGLRAADVLQFLEEISAHERLCAFELAEMNPLLDIEGRTARLAARLICAATG